MARSPPGANSSCARQRPASSPGPAPKTAKPSPTGARHRRAGWTTMSSSWPSARRSTASRGGPGPTDSSAGNPRPSPQPASSTPTRSGSGSSCNGSSMCRLGRSRPMPTRVACTSWVTCRSSSRTTVPTAGLARTCTTSMTTSRPPSSLACRPMTSGRWASAGATRCTAGTGWPPRTTPGGRRACSAHSARRMSSASTTSAALPATTKSPATAPMPSVVNGRPAPAWRCSTRSSRPWARCPSWPRTWASSPTTSMRCATAVASPA
mmetsp:Transcript_57671/g.135804  ORF Transcript_57671/g.135804 Transcript_57671/m.135804 type:complete len:265 (+) Transcript_57671:1029-1823(+)